MPTNYNRLAVSSEYSAVNYLPATLKTNKSGWLIEYYVENPQTQELQRKKIRLQRLLTRYANKGEAKKHINSIIVALNMKLSTGWNPYFEGEDSRMYTPIEEVCRKYVEETEKTQREATIRSYKSFIKIFLEWIGKQKAGIYSSMISHAMIVRFMDYVFFERKTSSGEDISAYTYNRYIKHGSALYNWMIEKCYCKENHFSKIKRKKTEDKRRILIPEGTREKIDDYLFGQGYRPGPVMVSEARMTKTWISLRKKLNLPKEMQMYSFRDTGMTEMIKNGIDPLSVKQLADHHSLDMTAIYTKHVDPNLREIVISKTPKFSKSEDSDSAVTPTP